MANREIICVYQDCVMCGDRGKKLAGIANEHGARIRKVSFASDEGRSLIRVALYEHKIGRFPFFTDGERFVTKLGYLFEKPKKTTRRKKTTKKKGKSK